MYQFELLISAQRAYEKICKTLTRNKKRLKSIIEQIEQMGESYEGMEKVREKMKQLEIYCESVNGLMDELGYVPIIIEEKDSTEYAKHLISLAQLTQKADQMKQVIALGEYSKKRMFDFVERTLDLAQGHEEKDFIIWSHELAVIKNAREQHLVTWQAKLNEGNEAIAKVEQVIKAIDTSNN